MVLTALGQKLTAALQRLRTSAVDDEVVKAILKDISAALLEADVNVALVKQVRDKVTMRIELEGESSGIAKGRLVEHVVVDELTRMLDPGKEPFKPKKSKSNVVMFVGLQGAGKTTTVAKYAHYYQQRRWRVGMVCADTFRAGAYDQLRQNATRVRVPYYGSYTETDPVKIAREGVEFFRRERCEIIIVDTSGRHKQEAALFEEMQQVAAAIEPDDVVFVMDSTIGQAAMAQARAFREAIAIGSVIITKLDGHAKGGGALSAVAATGSPIIFTGSGEHFDDLQAFNPSSFISKLLGRGDVKGLIADLQEKGVLEGQEGMIERLEKGKFTLRDMRDQFSSIIRLGPVSKLMEMMPGGISQIMGNLPPGVDANARLKRFLVMMDSMTARELDGIDQIDGPRLMRIARGSGSAPQEVAALLQTYKQFEGMVSKMSKSGLLRGGDAGLMTKMQRDPNAVMQRLTASMDPSMLRGMGGAGNLMSMMKAMSSGDVGKRMKDMMKGMGLG